MTFFSFMPGDTPPPAWLTLIAGAGILGYCIYEAWGIRRDIQRTGGDLFRTFLVFLVGAVIVAYGIMLTVHG
jgi:hypothetical protein